MNQHPKPIQRTSDPLRNALDRMLFEAQQRSDALLERRLREKASPWKRGLSRVGKN